MLANSGATLTAWRPVAPTPHTATVPTYHVPRNKTDHKRLRQSKNTLEPYTKPTQPKAGATSSVIMMSSLGRFSRRMPSLAMTVKTQILFPRSMTKDTTKFLPRMRHRDIDADSAADDYATGAASDSDDSV